MINVKDKNIPNYSDEENVVPCCGGDECGGLAQISSPLMHLQWPLEPNVNDDP